MLGSYLFASDGCVGSTPRRSGLRDRVRRADRVRVASSGRRRGPRRGSAPRCRSGQRRMGHRRRGVVRRVGPGRRALWRRGRGLDGVASASPGRGHRDRGCAGDRRDDRGGDEVARRPGAPGDGCAERRVGQRLSVGSRHRVHSAGRGRVRGVGARAIRHDGGRAALRRSARRQLDRAGGVVARGAGCALRVRHSGRSAARHLGRRALSMAGRSRLAALARIVAVPGRSAGARPAVIRRPDTMITREVSSAQPTSLAIDPAPIDVRAVPARPKQDRVAARPTMVWIAVAVVVSLLLRLRMLTTPLNADEGGYLAIARAWAHGRSLYGDVWVDRPQGLLVVFRLWDWISMDRTWSVHLMAALFGALLVVSTAVVAWKLYEQRAARATALICAVVSSAPIVEGYIANGELLSEAVAATGLAVALVGFDRRHDRRWMFLAGLLAGAAISIKQSGFDAMVAMLVWLAVTAVADRSRRDRAGRAAAWLVAGVVVVISMLLAHAAATGWAN